LKFYIQNQGIDNTLRPPSLFLPELKPVIMITGEEFVASVYQLFIVQINE